MEKMATQVRKQQGEVKTQTKNWIMIDELKVCSSTRNLQRGKELHLEAIENGNDSCIYCATALVNMYAKCGRMDVARQVFNSIKHPDVVSWTALILGYADNGEGVTALELFARMKSLGCPPNSFTFVAVLLACASLAQDQCGNKRAECLEMGKEIHSQIGCTSNLYVQNTLINMYAKCGCMIDAWRVFDRTRNPNVVSWNAIILGYADNGDGFTALNLFARMKFQGCVPNSLTFIAAIKACTCFALDESGSGIAECLDRGASIHLQIGRQLDIYVQSALINMYSKCRKMTEARHIFDSIKYPDVVSWNALIMGYADNGNGVVALDLLSRMRSNGCEPNSLTFVAALKACGLIGALECGRRIHTEMDTRTDVDHGTIVTVLVDFYAKCGDMVTAKKVFDSHPETRCVATWTALLAGYTSLGDNDTVFKLVKAMQDAGLAPNGITFLCILMCCSHAGLVDEGKEYLEAMSVKYRLIPTVEHYTCLVSVLGRSNKLDDALAMMRSMSCNPDVVAWMTVLTSCCKWENVDIGRLAFGSLVVLDEKNAVAYLLMSQIYGSKGMWKEQKVVLTMRKELRALKQPGQTCWTNEVGEVCTFR